MGIDSVESNPSAATSSTLVERAMPQRQAWTDKICSSQNCCDVYSKLMSESNESNE